MELWTSNRQLSGVLCKHIFRASHVPRLGWWGSAERMRSAGPQHERGKPVGQMSTKILLVAGARPNFMKIAPLMRVLGKNPAFVAKLVHTGQHYDDKLSKIFFDDLKIPRPDIELEVGSGTHAQQTAEIIKRFEPVL